MASDMQPGTEEFTERSSIRSAFSTDLGTGLASGWRAPLNKIASVMESIPKRYVVAFMAFLGFCEWGNIFCSGPLIQTRLNCHLTETVFNLLVHKALISTKN